MSAFVFPKKLRSKLIPLASEFTNWSQLEYFAINGLNLGAERFERLVDLVRWKSLMLDQSHHCFPELSLQLTPLLFQTFQSCGIFHNQSNVRGEMRVRATMLAERHSRPRG